MPASQPTPLFNLAPRWWLTAVCLLLLPVPAPPAAAEHSEAQLKAGFLYNFVKHTAWPTPNHQRVLCIAPGSLPAEAVSGIDGLPLPEARLVIRRIGKPDGILECDILFLGRAQRSTIDAWLGPLSNRAVLTISDLSATERSGAMIQMFTEGRRIRYALDLAPVSRAGLTLSPRLLNLADTLYSE